MFLHIFVLIHLQVDTDDEAFHTSAFRDELQRCRSASPSTSLSPSQVPGVPESWLAPSQSPSHPDASAKLASPCPGPALSHQHSCESTAQVLPDASQSTSFNTVIDFIKELGLLDS
jgi:hypothetical protein